MPPAPTASLMARAKSVSAAGVDLSDTLELTALGFMASETGEEAELADFTGMEEDCTRMRLLNVGRLDLQEAKQRELRESKTRNKNLTLMDSVEPARSVLKAHALVASVCFQRDDDVRWCSLFFSDRKTSFFFLSTATE